VRRRTNHTPPIFDIFDLSKAYQHLKIAPSFPLSNIQFYTFKESVPIMGQQKHKEIAFFFSFFELLSHQRDSFGDAA